MLKREEKEAEYDGKKKLLYEKLTGSEKTEEKEEAGSKREGDDVKRGLILRNWKRKNEKEHDGDAKK